MPPGSVGTPKCGSAGPPEPLAPQAAPVLHPLSRDLVRGWRTGTVGVVRGAHSPAPTCLSCLVFRRLALAALVCWPGDSGAKPQLSRQDRCEGVPAAQGELPGPESQARPPRGSSAGQQPSVVSASAPVLPGSSSPASRVTRVLAEFRSWECRLGRSRLLFILHKDSHRLTRQTVYSSSLSLWRAQLWGRSCLEPPGAPSMRPRALWASGQTASWTWAPALPCSPRPHGERDHHRPLQLGQPVGRWFNGV